MGKWTITPDGLVIPAEGEHFDESDLLAMQTALLQRQATLGRLPDDSIVLVPVHETTQWSASVTVTALDEDGRVLDSETMEG